MDILIAIFSIGLMIGLLGLVLPTTSNFHHK